MGDVVRKASAVGEGFIKEGSDMMAYDDKTKTTEDKTKEVADKDKEVRGKKAGDADDDDDNEAAEAKAKGDAKAKAKAAARATAGKLDNSEITSIAFMVETIPKNRVVTNRVTDNPQLNPYEET
ncbi:hypothetical protein MSG28_015005 [Choristoneura fumiferana]|uniref:Uncharacterized protein n=1 Tax=Choristoneura fumiferana TaxID=7141 RepID=A0ACC0KYM3_CHOFU|nr:hypothetical protein MSG28_015005 [Choristoneura fumiferana]